MTARRRAGVLLALALVGCTAEADTAPPDSVWLPMATWPPTAPPNSSTTTSTTEPAPKVDPSHDVIPIGECDSIADDAIGYRNETGNVADLYELIGVSQEGRPIWSEHWGDLDGPQVLVLGQVHGDECAGAWFVQAIRNRPPTTFGIWLVPTINPDGLAAHSRKLSDGTDPNRDGFLLATPEARAVMNMTDRVQPVLTIHVHSPYQWIGAHNGGLATEVAQAMSDAVGWGPIPNAGRVQNGELAFLWEGQERIIPGHPSVLIEFPAVAEAESPAPPDLSQKDVASVPIVAALAIEMRDAMYRVVAAA